MGKQLPTSESSVSVVIATCQRPHLIARAVRSALAQTLAGIEVLVVLDGPDEATLAALRPIADTRLRVEVLPEHSGLSRARNRGVQLARSPWVAFLDDDDEWMPDKLACQLTTAERSTNRYPIVACRFLACDGSFEYLWPRRLPRPDEPLCEYLFCRRSPFFGEGMVLAGSLLMSRSLLAAVPFSPDAVRCEDVDWLLRAVAHTEARVEFVPTAEPLMRWNRRPSSPKARKRTRRAGWRFYLAWLTSLRPILTRRAYGSALLTWYAASAVRSGEKDAFWAFLSEAIHHGRPTPLDVLIYLASWCVPPQAQARASRAYVRLRRHG